MQPRNSISPVFSHDDGLIVNPMPVGGFFYHVVGDLRRLARVRVPTVVAVETDHVQMTTLEFIVFDYSVILVSNNMLK